MLCVSAIHSNFAYIFCLFLVGNGRFKTLSTDLLLNYIVYLIVGHEQF